MSAFLPPSSRVTFLIVGAAWALIAAPTGTEPVKVTTSTSGWLVNRSPASSSPDVTTLRMPGGNPALSATSATNSADNGVAGAGLSTTVQPAASAGPILDRQVKKG